MSQKLRILILKSSLQPVMESDREAARFRAWQVECSLRDILRTRDANVMGVAFQAETSKDFANYGARLFAKLLKSPEGEAVVEFNPTHHHHWGGLHRQYCGLAPTPGTTGVTYAPCGSRTTVHEILHNLGLNHCNSVSPDGGRTEYGHRPCVMGEGGEICGAHLLHLGLLRPEVVSDGVYPLIPTDCSAFEADAVGANQVLITSTGSVMLSTMKHSNGGLTVQTGQTKEPDHRATLREGQNLEINGHTIYHLGTDGEAVLVGVNDKDAGKASLPGLPKSNMTPEPGVYTDSRYDAHGVLVSGGKAVVLAHSREPVTYKSRAHYPLDWFVLNDSEGANHSWYTDGSNTYLFLIHPEHGRCAFQLSKLIQGEPERVSGSHWSWSFGDKPVHFSWGSRDPLADYLMRPIGGTDRHWTICVDGEAWEVDSLKMMSYWEPKYNDLD
jgi:hypothetical protein